MAKVAKRKNDFDFDKDKQKLTEIEISNEIEESNLALHDIFSVLKTLFASLMKKDCDVNKTESSIHLIFDQIKDYLKAKV